MSVKNQVETISISKINESKIMKLISFTFLILSHIYIHIQNDNQLTAINEEIWDKLNHNFHKYTGIKKIKNPLSKEWIAMNI